MDLGTSQHTDFSEVTTRDLLRIAKKHPSLESLVNSYFTNGFSDQWYSQHHATKANTSVKGLVLRVIFGDPLICKKFPAPHPFRLSAYIDYCANHPDSIYKLARSERNYSTENIPKYFRHISTKGKNPHLFLMELLFSHPCADFLGSSKAAQAIKQSYYLRDDTLRDWFQISNDNSPLPHYVVDSDFLPSLHNFCAFVRAFLKKPYDGKLQNKIPASVREILCIDKGVPSFLVALDVLSLMHDNIIPVEPNTTLGKLFLKLIKLPGQELEMFLESIRSVCWLTLARFELIENQVGSTPFFGYLYNKTRLIEKHDFYRPFIQFYEQCDPKIMLGAIRDRFGKDVRHEVTRYAHLLRPEYLALSFRELANIFQRILLANIDPALDSESVDYAECLPITALWRLGLPETETPFKGKVLSHKRTRTGEKAYNSAHSAFVHDILNQRADMIFWRPGVPIPEGAHVCVHQAFKNIVRWPKNVTLYFYGTSSKLYPHIDPFIDGESMLAPISENA